MRPADEVRRHVLDTVPRLGSELVSYERAVGRVLAAPIIASEDVPAFANSGMDGYAVRGVDVGRPGAVLSVLADLPAGKVSPAEVGPGQAVKIMTGAPLPAGADTVVRVEDTNRENGGVVIGPAVAPGTHVRPSGGDILRGATVLDAGTRLNPVHIGVLAALGVVEVEVARAPRVAVMSTGDELAPPSTGRLGPGAIRDSNRPMLMALLAGVGAQVVDLGSLGDDPTILLESLRSGAALADVVVTTGGVSMGDYDVVKAALSDLGVEFMQVAINPGKPLGYGALDDRPFFGLPGNPVSVLVTYEQFVRPALLHMQGARALLRPRIQGVAGEVLHSDPMKEAFIRVRAVDHNRWEVVPTGAQSSNVLSGAGRADCFAVVPVGVSSVETGDAVTLELFKADETREVQV